MRATSSSSDAVAVGSRYGTTSILLETHEPNDWPTAAARLLLGEALAGQKKLTEAELILEAGAEGLARHADKLPEEAKTRLAQTFNPLALLHEGQGQTEAAARWRAERDKLKKSSPGKTD